MIAQMHSSATLIQSVTVSETSLLNHIILKLGNSSYGTSLYFHSKREKTWKNYKITLPRKIIFRLDSLINGQSELRCLFSSGSGPEDS